MATRLLATPEILSKQCSRPSIGETWIAVKCRSCAIAFFVTREDREALGFLAKEPQT